MGLATARLAIKKGYEVIIAGRNIEKLKEAQSFVTGSVKTYQIDLMQDKGVILKTDANKVYDVHIKQKLVTTHILNV